MEKKAYTDPDLRLLEEGLEVFRTNGSFKLQCKTYICLAGFYKQNPERSIEYVKNALEVMNAHGIKEFDKQIRELETSANKKIKDKYHNKFYFLNSYPLKDQPNPMRFGGLNFEKSVKTELLDILKNENKDIIIHFDVFNEKILNQIWGKSTGCKMLAIDFLYLEPDALVFEEDGFQPKKLTIKDLQARLAANEQPKVNVDILMVVSDQPQPIITEFAELFKIPLTIYFDFKTGTLTNFNFYKEYLMRHFMYNFSLNFTHCICKGQTFEQAINNAKSDSVDKLYDSLKKSFKVKSLQRVPGGADFIGKPKMIPAKEINEFCKDAVKLKFSGDYLKQTLELKTGMQKGDHPGSLRDTTHRENKLKFPPISWCLRRDKLVVDLYEKLQK